MKRSASPVKSSKNSGKQKPIIGYYGYWVILTYSGVFTAVLGMYFALSGNIGAAIVCLMVCGFCDMLDGPVARRRSRAEREESFGIQIDALADLVNFGVFPVVIGYAVGTHSYFGASDFAAVIISVAVSTLYCLCALIRLAYFNVVEIELHNKKEKRVYYEGMPVTFVAMIISLVYSICLFFSIPFSSVYSVMLLVFSIAFVIRVRIPKLRGKQLIVFVLVSIPIVTFIILNISGGA